MSTHLDEPRRRERDSRPVTPDDRHERRRAAPPPRENGYDSEEPRGKSSREESPAQRPSLGRNGDSYDSRARRKTPSDEERAPPPPRHHDDEDGPPRRKDTLRDFARENDDRHNGSRRGTPRPHGGDETPRSRDLPRRERHDDRDLDRRHGPPPSSRRHSPREDRDRGYRSDGHDDKRDRRSHKDRDRRDRDRDRDRDRHRDRDRGHRKDRERARSADDRRDRDRPNRSDKGPDINGMMEKGKKHWNTVEPVAKPLLGALAKAYLDGAHGGAA